MSTPHGPQFSRNLSLAKEVGLRTRRTRTLTQGLVKTIIWIAALATIEVMVLIFFQVLREGLPVLSPHFFLDPPKDIGRGDGILPMIVGTFALML
jgi:ABC-type phosphate transport system permease subunit